MLDLRHGENIKKRIVYQKMSYYRDFEKHWEQLKIEPNCLKVPDVSCPFLRYLRLPGYPSNCIKTEAAITVRNPPWVISSVTVEDETVWEFTIQPPEWINVARKWRIDVLEKLEFTPFSPFEYARYETDNDWGLFPICALRTFEPSLVYTTSDEDEKEKMIQRLSGERDISLTLKGYTVTNNQFRRAIMETPWRGSDWYLREGIIRRTAIEPSRTDTP